MVNKDVLQYVERSREWATCQLGSSIYLTPDSVHFDDQPIDVTIQDKPNFEQVNLINQLDEEYRTVVFKIIDTMLTKRSLKISFKKTWLRSKQQSPALGQALFISQYPHLLGPALIGRT